jgi:hypothetical protein
MEIKQFTPRIHVRHSGNLTYCYILNRVKIVKKFDKSFDIIPEQEVQSDYKEGNPEVKAESLKTEILETEKKNLTKKKETPESESTVQTSLAKKALPLVSPKSDRLKVKVIPAEPAETFKTVSVQSASKKPDYEDLPAKDDKNV